MDFEGLSQQEKVEYVGFIEANRLFIPEWENHNSFYESCDGKVSVILQNEDDESAEIKLAEEY